MTALPANDLRQTLTRAALPHVAFDGWSKATFDAAVADAGVDPLAARAAAPRGALDLAVAHHRAGDAALPQAMAEAGIDGLRYSQRVAAAVRTRIGLAGEREVVRRAASLFSLPHLAPEGAALIWGTADAIWTALGDTSQDVNWYSKRAILSGVYASSVLFWLGDQSPDCAATGDFIERRIANVMQFEKAKAQVRDSRVLGPLAKAAARLTQTIHAPRAGFAADLPGSNRRTD